MKNHKTAALGLAISAEELERLRGSPELINSFSLTQLGLSNPALEQKSAEELMQLAIGSYDHMRGPKAAVDLLGLMENYNAQERNGLSTALDRINQAAQSYLDISGSAYISRTQVHPQLAKPNRATDSIERYVEEAMRMANPALLTGSTAADLIPQLQTQIHTYIEELSKPNRATDSIERYVEEAMRMANPALITGIGGLTAAELIKNTNQQTHASIFGLATANAAKLLGIGQTDQDFNRAMTGLLSQTLHAGLERYSEELERGIFRELKEPFYKDLCLFPDPHPPLIKKPKPKKKKKKAIAKQEGFTPFEAAVIEALQQHTKRKFSITEICAVITLCVYVLNSYFEHVHPLLIEKQPTESRKPTFTYPELHAGYKAKDTTET